MKLALSLKGRRYVLVAYHLPQSGVFDTTCAQLDALANDMDGKEIPFLKG